VWVLLLQEFHFCTVKNVQFFSHEMVLANEFSSRNAASFAGVRTYRLRRARGTNPVAAVVTGSFVAYRK